MESTVGSDNEGKKRRRLSVDEKASIIREHLQGKVPISDLADKHGLQPSVIYGWIKVAMDNLGGALDGTGKVTSKDASLSREVEGLKARLAKKDAVIAEISEEYVALKKELGDL